MAGADARVYQPRVCRTVPILLAFDEQSSLVPVTLVLSVGTPECLYQISDRRLTRSDGTVTTDDENKATIWFGRMIFGYSGLAEIDGQPTDRWFAFTAGDAPHREQLQSVLDFV